MFFFVIYMFEIYLSSLYPLNGEEKDSACDTLQRYCCSAGVHVLCWLGVCAPILSESRTLGFDIKIHPSVLTTVMQARRRMG